MLKINKHGGIIARDRIIPKYELNLEVSKPKRCQTNMIELIFFFSDVLFWVTNKVFFSGIDCKLQ